MLHWTSELTGCTITMFCLETRRAVVAWTPCIIMNIHYLNRPTSFSLAQPWQRGANELRDNTLPCYCFEITQVFLPVRLFLDNWLQNIRQLFLKTNYLPPPPYNKGHFSPCNYVLKSMLWCRHSVIFFFSLFFLTLSLSCLFLFFHSAYRQDGLREASVWHIGRCPGNHLDAVNDGTDAEAESAAGAAVLNHRQMGLRVKCNGLPEIKGSTHMIRLESLYPQHGAPWSNQWTFNNTCTSICSTQPDRTTTLPTQDVQVPHEI